MTKLSRTTLTSDAYDAVREMLLEPGRFRPGEKVSIEMLSRELGVSRSPVWSAIARLDAEGLVNVSPRQGVYLVAFDEERLRNIYELREALEGLATGLAATRMTEAEIEHLHQIVRHQQTLLTTQSKDDFSASALEFHEAILSGARNPLIREQLLNLYARTRAMCRGRDAEYRADILKRNYEDHLEIVRHLARRDVASVEFAARAHVRRLLVAALGSKVDAED